MIRLVLGLVTVLAAGGAAAEIQAPTIPPATSRSAEREEIDPSHVQAAAARFALSRELVMAVIAAESGGRANAVSSAGAMGLMQLMPATWAMLRQRLALGSDPFDPADNILAGAAYLRELLDRYGDPGFLAAYNAGPRRYEASLAGQPLPAETQAYVARIAERLRGQRQGSAPSDRQMAYRTGLFPAPWSTALGHVAPTLDGRLDGLFAPRGEAMR